MKTAVRPLMVSLAAVAVAATALPLLPVWLRGEAKESVPVAAPRATDALVVDLADNASVSDIADIERKTGLNLEFNSVYAEDDKLMRASLAPGTDPARLLAMLRQDGRVEAAEPEILYSIPEPSVVDPASPESGAARPASGRFVPNDPRYSEQWNLRMIGAEAAWEKTRGKGAVVAVIDTGVAFQDSERGHRAKDFDRTQFVAGYDFVHDDKDPFDDNGHGTHVAGTVAESTDNGEGAAGLAFEARIMPLKVLTAQGSGTVTDIADAIRFAADNGANVINLSLGGPTPSMVLRAAVKYAHKKGVTVVCAAGNGFGEPVGYPAAYPESIAVSSVGPTGEIAFYSSYGKQVALAAPGGDKSTRPEDGILQNTIFPENQGGKGDDYYYFQGTSMASPHVAATAALLVSQGIKDPERVRDLLVRSATPKAPKLKYGAGILSAEKATRTAAEQSRAGIAKWALFGLLGMISLLAPRRTPLAGRLGIAAALAVGMFGPDLASGFFGANSPWNLLTFSAALPFFLYWEWEKGATSRALGALALGVALCLGGSFLTGNAAFTATEFGARSLPWIVANAGAALLVALAAWRRA